MSRDKNQQGTANGPVELVVFTLEDQSYALHLSAVERVVRAVEVTPLPAAPTVVLGVVNAGGRIVPVINIRSRFGLPEREIDPADQLLFAQSTTRTVALVVDSVTNVIHRSPEDLVAGADILPKLDYVDGATKINGDLIFIHDLDTFLSLDEDRVLDEALEAEPETDEQPSL